MKENVSKQQACIIRNSKIWKKGYCGAKQQHQHTYKLTINVSKQQAWAILDSKISKKEYFGCKTACKDTYMNDEF
jgi:hypothetical protein